MEIKQSITLDFARSTMPVTVFAKQYDKDTRKIEITPLNNGSPYELETGITARLQMTKNDGTTVINNASISSGKITATLTAQCLTAAGTAVAEIGLYKGSTLLSSQTFYIEVQKGAYDENAPKSSDEYGALLEAFERVDQAEQKAETAVSTANAASARAEAAAATASTAATNADNAAASANESAYHANIAANSASSAASRAETAVTTANNAADRAETAVTNANAANTTANSAASRAETAVTNANAALAEAREITGNLQSLLEEVHYGHVIE